MWREVGAWPPGVPRDPGGSPGRDMLRRAARSARFDFFLARGSENNCSCQVTGKCSQLALLFGTRSRAYSSRGSLLTESDLDTNNSPPRLFLLFFLLVYAMHMRSKVKFKPLLMRMQGFRQDWHNLTNLLLNSTREGYDLGRFCLPTGLGIKTGGVRTSKPSGMRGVRIWRLSGYFTPHTAKE